MTTSGRDRLRELLDAVLDTDNRSLAEMAGDAFSSAWHFSRQIAGATGEPPVALRRRVMLERAAWQLQHGHSVTDVAIGAGYDSVDGFARAYARAFGHPPSATTPGSSHRLPAPNGVHFHPPVNLWVQDASGAAAPDPLTAQLVHHDIDDTRMLLTLAAQLSDADYHAVRWPGLQVLTWDGPEESVAAVLHHLVRAKDVWLASFCGDDLPPEGGEDLAGVRARFEQTAPRWVALVRDIGVRGAWNDRLIDALCDPPESFVVGGVISHVLTYAAHRRQLARHLLRAAGVDTDHGDPLDWLNRRSAR